MEKHEFQSVNHHKIHKSSSIHGVFMVIFHSYVRSLDDNHYLCSPHGARIPHLRVIIELLREIPGKIQKSAREREPGWVHLVTLTISTKNSLYSEAMAMTLMKISLGLVMCDVCTWLKIDVKWCNSHAGHYPETRDDCVGWWNMSKHRPLKQQILGYFPCRYANQATLLHKYFMAVVNNKHQAIPYAKWSETGMLRMPTGIPI